MRHKIFVIMAVALISPFIVNGETVSQKQAQELANVFFNISSGRLTPPPKLAYNGRKLTTNRLFTPFYVYNSTAGGFVIISAENKAFPILGFSLKDNFDPNDMGEVETALLKSYAREIEFIRYDSAPVEETIKAWQQFKDNSAGILSAIYTATDPKITVEEAFQIIDNALEKDDAVFSDIYTPDQWKEMILDELRLKETVPLAVIGDGNIFPAVVYGHQGDYFRLEMDKKNSWLMRLNATETIESNMVTVVGNPILLPDEVEEEKAFEIHDLFIEEVAEQEIKRKEISSIDKPAFNGEPFVKAIGGGHFEITLPENGAIATVYNISGSMITKKTFSDSPLIMIDISSEPSGFYFVNIIGETGESYGLKLIR